MRVLLVGDDLDLGLTVATAVKDLGYQCSVADSEAEAWEIVQSSSIALILSSYLDCSDFCEKLRELATHDYTYFVLLGRKRDQELLFKGLDAGADDYLLLPAKSQDIKIKCRNAEMISGLHQDVLRTQRRAAGSNKMAALGQLAAGVAHELNTPLGAVSLSLESALMRVEDATKVEKKINISLQAVETMQKIVAQLLDYSTKDSKAEGNCELNQVIIDTIKLLGIGFRKADVTLEKELGEDLKVAIPGSQLQQIVINLLTNGRDAVLMDGSEAKTVFISSRKVEDHAILEVKDSGPGIPESIRERLFEPFFTTKPAGSGTGLGLSVIQSIAKRFKAEIEVDSKPGETIFRVSLPLTR